MATCYIQRFRYVPTRLEGAKQKMKEAAKTADLPSLFCIFDPDYMGSAEFEFGALPKALRRFIADKEQLVAETATIEGYTVYLIGKPEKVGLFKNIVLPHILGEYRDQTRDVWLKEPTYLENPYFRAKNIQTYACWFSLMDGVVFTFDKDVSALWLTFLGKIQ